MTASARRKPRTTPVADENLFALGRRLGTLDVVVCCGSGGVGKTTVSAALALSIAASHDRKVLVLTVDPARRLATALGVSIGADPVLLPRARLRRAGIPQRGEVWAAMLDMKLAWDRLIERAAPGSSSAASSG